MDTDDVVEVRYLMRGEEAEGMSAAMEAGFWAALQLVVREVA